MGRASDSENGGQSQGCHFQSQGTRTDFKGFVEVENFGERLQATKEPILCIFNMANFKVEVIEIEYKVCGCDGVRRFPAEAVFVDENSVIFMGIDVGSKKLGMTYIYCRPTSIYLMKLTDKVAGKKN